MTDKTEKGKTPQYMPQNGNGTRVDLAVLKTEIVHGFTHIDRRLSGIEERQHRQQNDIDKCKTELAVLQATALRIDTIRLSAVVAATVTIMLGLATLIAKIAGLW